MKTFLIIEEESSDNEYGRTFEHVVSGETFREALKKTYFHESIGEWVINMDYRNITTWPTNVAKDLGECYIPDIKVYEITRELNNLEVRESLDAYLQEVLDSAVADEKQHRAGAEDREKAEKLAALEKAAAELGMDLTPKEG
jgi:hypothetical protein